MDDSRHIENLIYRYAELIDQGDLAGVAELFRHGAIVSPAHNSRRAGYAEVLQMYELSCRLHEPSGTPLTRHVTTNVIVEVDGEQASARSYYSVLQATDNLALQPIIAGHYHDTFHRIEGEWCFETREMYVDLVGDCSQHLLYSTEGLSG
ncbi:MAG: nuclear transport factor 2 family protein [Halioglobus sp.]|nr:nuclear transport factor 2 family protein [Halioglobus sp.]